MWSGWARLALAAVAAGLLVVVGTLSGSGLSPDSVSYISAARSLLAGDGLRDFAGEALADWPPLYPVVLAGLSLVGLDPAQAARVVGVGSHGALVALCGWWLLARVRTPSVAWCAVLALGVAPTLLWPAVWAWSESMFVVLAVGGLVAMDRHARSPTWATLVAAAGLAGGAALTRYAGIAVIATGCLFLAWRGRRRVGAALVEVAVFGLVASLPLVLWLLRNQAMTGTLMGERHPGQWTVSFNVARVVAYMSTWILPVASDGAWLSVAWALLVMLIGAAAWMGWRGRGGGAPDSGSESTSGVGGGAAERSGADVLVLFVLAYLAMVVWSASTVALDVINDRLLAPAFPAAVLMVALGADAGLRRDREDTRLPRVMAAAFGLWMLLSAPVIAELLGAGAAGQGYRSGGWQESEIVSYLRSASLQGVVLSNDAPGVYFETGHRVEWGPRRHVYGSPQTVPDDISPIERLRARGEPVTLVWFDRAPPYFKSRDELGRDLPLSVTAELQGGAVLTVH